MAGNLYFKHGRCTHCGLEDCTDLCHHYGAVVCRRSLKRLGEKLFLSGQDELGIHYYSMAIYVEQTSGINPAVHLNNRPNERKQEPASKFESIKARALRNAKVLESDKQTGLGGIFGVFTPKPVNRTSAMSFQHDYE